MSKLALVSCTLYVDVKIDVRDGKVSDVTVWATNRNSYAIKVDETNGDVLVNPKGKKI
ncbi:MAG TPA: hypothetical protein VGE97_00815 [Nitrososphaera sp.]